MGISSNPLARIHTPDHGTITDTGIPDDAEGGGVGRYFVFDGPSVTHLMTSNNGGPGGSDTGRLVHSAGPGGPSQPIAFPSAFRGNRQLFGADDISNAQFEPGRRYLVSEVPAQILKDAYTYAIVPPQQFGTFFAVLDQSTGNLLIRGGPGTSADNISLRRSGPDLVVAVDVGNDTPGSHVRGDNSNAPAWVSQFAFAAVNNITIDAGGGADAVTLDMTGGDVIPAGGIAYDGGTGADEITAIANANFILRDDRLTVAGFGDVGLTSGADADLTGGAGDNTFTVSGWSGTGVVDGAGGSDTVIATNAGDFTLAAAFLDRTNRGRLGLSRIARANLTGDANLNRFTVSGWSALATLDGLGGFNEVVSTNDADFTLSGDTLSRSSGGVFTLGGIAKATLTGGASANTFIVSDWVGLADLDGAGGGDDYRINLAIGNGVFDIDDSGGSGVDDLTVNGTDLRDVLTVRRDAVLRLSQAVNYSGIERLLIGAGSGNDTVTVDSASTSLIVNGGFGDDTVNLTYDASIQFDPLTGLTTVFSIPTSVLVNGNSGTADVLNVSFTGITIGKNGELTTNRLTVNLLGGDGLSYSAIDRLNLNFNAGGDVLGVFATDAGVTTTARMGGGADTVFLGGSTVNNIRGPIVIDGGANAAGTSDVVILQESEPGGTTNVGALGNPVNAAVGTGFVSGFGMGSTVSFTTIESVQVNEGPSNDTVNLAFASPRTFLFSLNLDGGTDGIVFHGTDRNDRIRVSRQVGPNGPEVIAEINGHIISGGYAGGETVSVFAGDGNDHVEMDSSVTTWTTEIFGEDGNDQLQGGPLADWLDGGDGNDQLRGGAGDDELIGGDGRDDFDGEEGADRIHAADGDKDDILIDLGDLILDLDPKDKVHRRHG